MVLAFSSINFTKATRDRIGSKHGALDYALSEYSSVQNEKTKEREIPLEETFKNVFLPRMFISAAGSSLEYKHP